jgi:FkbM family methyltransferase
MSNYSSTTFGFGTGTRQFYFRKQSTDEGVIQQILVDQQHNLNPIGRTPELLAFAHRREATGRRPLVVDAGANIGASPIYFIANLPSALVVAIEPDLENFELLSKNVEGLNVEPLRGAVASTAGRARVLDPGRGAWAYRTEPIGEAGKDAADVVPRVTINDIYESHRSAHFPFMVKVDIEGAESELFSANTEWVALTPLIIVELHDWMLPKSGISKSFLQCIAQLDRDFIHIGGDIFSIANDLDALAVGR